MGIDKLASNVFKAVSPIMQVGKMFGSDKKKEEPAAAKPAAAATDTAARQGQLNPLILTSAAGATDPYSVGKKLLMGQ
jgi:hypothetical protein